MPVSWRSSLRALQVLLVILGVDAAIKGILLMFGGKALLMRLFAHLPGSEFSRLLLLSRPQEGALDLGLSLMLFLAARDPRGNRVVVYGVSVALALGALAEVVSFYTVGGRGIYPLPWVWGHSLARLAVAVLLYLWRPRGIHIRPLR